MNLKQTNRYIRRYLRRDERYKDFKFMLKNPIPFNKLFKNQNFEVVQLHDIRTIENFPGIIGFCGAFKWNDNKIENIDSDTYYEDTLVYGYSIFNDGEAIDILVKDW